MQRNFDMPLASCPVRRIAAERWTLADDVPVHDITVHDGLIWVNPKSRNSNQVHKDRLLSGLEQNIGLVIAKAIVGLMEAGVPDTEIAAFGVKQRRQGWGSGLTILTAMANVLPKLDKQGRILALFQDSCTRRANQPVAARDSYSIHFRMQAYPKNG